MQAELIEGTYDAKAAALIANVKRQNEIKAKINGLVGDLQLDLNDLRREYRELEPEVIEWLEGLNDEAEAEIVAEWVKLRVETREKPVRVESTETDEVKSIRLEPMEGDPPEHVAGLVANVYKRRRKRERAPAEPGPVDSEGENSGNRQPEPAVIPSGYNPEAADIVEARRRRRGEVAE